MIHENYQILNNEINYKELVLICRLLLTLLTRCLKRKKEKLATRPNDIVSSISVNKLLHPFVFAFFLRNSLHFVVLKIKLKNH